MRRRILALSTLIGWSAPALAAPAPSTSTSTRAVAPAPEPNRLDEARRLGSVGLVAYDQGDYAAAVDSLTKAIEFHDAPTLRLYRARAFAQLGRWDAACEDYELIVLAPAVAGETPVAAQARDAAVPESKNACDRVTGVPSTDSGNDATPRQDATSGAQPPADSAASAASAPALRAEPLLEVELSFGAMRDEVEVSRNEFADHEGASSSVASRMALSWYPLHEPVRSWLGFGASWVQDYGSGRFNYSEALGIIMSHYRVDRWRFGAQLGTGFLRSGLNVLNQGYIVLKPSAQAGVRFGDFSANAIAALVVPIEDVGPSLYSHFSGRGIEGRLELDHPVWRWLGVRLSATLSRFEFDLDETQREELDGDELPRAVSVVDLYTSTFFSFTVNL